MKIKLICCQAFTRISCQAIAKSPHKITPVFLKLLSHNDPDDLREKIRYHLQDADQYDAVILGYGLCGNATIGLSCASKLIIPRAHDCCTIFLGGTDKFIKYFAANPSMRWGSCGYLEECDAPDYWETQKDLSTNPEYLKLVEDYGEENAEYVWETMHPDIETPQVAYIHIDGFEYNDTEKEFAEYAAKKEKELLTLQGTTAVIDDLIMGNWDPSRFCILNPGEKLEPLYDLNMVFKNM